MQRTMISRRLFLVGASALTLSACGGNVLGLGPPEGGLIYPLRPTFPAGSGEKVAWALAILRPDVVGGLDSERIALVQADGTLDFYAKATYPDRLPPIVQQALLDSFEASGRIDAVAPEQAALHADYNLLVEVKHFEARYKTQDGIPEVQVTLSAKLTTAHGRKIIASFTTDGTATSSVNSVAAVIQTLQDLLGKGATAIANWTLNTAPAVPPGQSAETVSPGKPAEQLLHDATRGSGRLREKLPPQ